MKILIFNQITMTPQEEEINKRPKVDWIPLGNRVIVTRFIEETGMIMSEELKQEQHPDIGIIQKVGNIGWWNKYVRGIRPGRRIAFILYSPVAVKDADYEVLFVDLLNILAIEPQ